MDPFDTLLRGVHADGAAFGRSVLTPPWALRFTDGAPLTLCVPLRGEGWISHPESDKPRLVRVGEVAAVRGPTPFTFSAEPRSSFHPGELRDVRRGRTGTIDAVDADHTERLVLLVGVYHVRGRVPQRLLGALPPVVVVPDDHDCAALRDYLDAQLDAGRPGRQIVLDRLLDWLLVCTVRDWFDQPDAEAPGWYRGLSDDTVGPVLRAMHDDPGRSWTLASLAGQAGVSRSTLAKRFTAMVGEPPLTYLTDWRMTLAADMLAESTATVAAVARQLGYADPFGFSAAFKRVHGMSPSGHRRLAREGEKAA
ncbi:AraC family transcriptional regulator [Micromonospora sp. LAH09]|uniref:AraC family transcriptional regulator n=1 Tax=Micromonospora cabrerizensis TaxID=2911213 RepID=UPI001EE799C7|nr:AraC family transcriptional regulator [Micromonospora cabrerizensis]MCG5470465.1 AraC family transcriptional regulator [Micromonospora cabrerizensis]